MDYYILLTLLFAVMATSAWSVPFYPVPRAPLRFTRFAPLPPRQKIPAREPDDDKWNRPKRDHDDFNYDSDHDHGHDRGQNRGHNRGHSGGVTGPVHTFVKTDKNANYKWGVRHHVGNKYAS